MTQWVVVGAGSAGCVMAARLAERAGDDVTLIEAGSAVAPDAIHSASFFDALATTGWTYPGAFTRGRGAGGSSAVNGMIATPLDGASARAWGWRDASAARAKVRVPTEVVDDDELGPMDRALCVAAPDAEKAALTRRDGRRVSAFDAYLDGSSPVELVAGRAVDRIEIEGTRATGVRLVGGDRVDADAVVVCAGAIGTPALLVRSGVTLDGVGRHLRNHVGLPIVVRQRPGTEQDERGLVTAATLRRGDLQILPMNHLGPDVPGHAGFLIVVMTPTGEGTVTPDCEVTFEVTTHDRSRLAAGLDIVRELMAHPAFVDVIDTTADVVVGDAPAGVYHATSTCRMGTVVGADGAVLGYDGLSVVDASIFPDLPTTNPYLPTLMLAERLAPRLRAPAGR